MKNFNLKSNYLKSLILLSIYKAKSGHPGGCLSCSDFLLYLFEREMNLKKKDFKNWDRTISFCPKDIVRLHCMLLVILKNF